ncbi:monooxygenase [Laetiporus sulphureus 93-53]|uniref:Monooxygenase n=1 Tax=Laetiporus sulphureus 93-53 TaxID=1314785 RepID=A0A165ER42_9APHY|nr:monooxygenase [Laetiporus sulphureus 93-53]KZT07591.1 monooxygenase [Laetiporus sulphureus 93-53]
MSTTTLPVLIVGAGPTGLVLGLTLAQNGIPFRIIDKETKYHIGQRGAGIQPRTLEAYNLLGVLPDIVEKGVPHRPMRIYKLPGGVEVERSFYLVPPANPEPSKPYINPWLIGQATTEAILRAHLEKFGHRVELGTELRGFEQSADGVTVQIARKEGEHETLETVTCRWLVGADGGKGVVRKQLGLTFLGESLQAELIIGDIEVGNLDSDVSSSRYAIPNDTAVVLRPSEEKGLFFVAVSGSDVDYAKIMADDDALLETIRKVTNRNDLEFGVVRWKSDYRPSVRMVNKFGEGRVFLAGDAAHIHSPTGGQGLNSGVQDALNLGWKLALVEKGLATPSLLSTFNEERHPVIKFMLTETTAIFRQRFAATATTPFGRDGWQRGQHLQQLGVNYRWSSIVRDERAPDVVKEPMDVYGINSDDVPRAGDRAPDAPGLVDVKGGDATSLFRIFSPSRHTVLIFSSDETKAKSALDALKPYPRDVLRSVIIYPQDAQSTASIGGADLVLVDRDGYAYSDYAVEKDAFTIVAVRPDGVIGAIAAGAEGLTQYFHGVFSAVA